MGWFVAVVVALFVMQWAVGEINRRILIRQTREEFAQLQRMLEKFRERNGEYPRVSSNPILLQCLLGRFDAHGKPIPQQPWFLAGANLFFRDREPEKLGNHIVDPWGTSYVYRAFPGEDSWQLVSAGPDRKHSNWVLWAPMQNGTAPEDADNLLMTSAGRTP